MNTAIQTPANMPFGLAQASSGNKPRWAAVGLLSAAVLAMGGTMLYRQGAQSAVTAAPVAALAAPAVLAAAPRTALPLASNDAADDLVEKPAAVVKKVVVKPVQRPAPALRYASVSPAPQAAAYPTNRPGNNPSNTPNNYRSSYPTSQPTNQALNQPVAYPQASVCATCGSVESVTAVERPGKPSPISVGSVAGGVIGAALGSQVGRGNGRTLATVLGAVGGGFAGHAIEGQVRKETVYQVGVRMEDGSRRTVESATAPSVGSRVTVDGNGLQGQTSSYERRAAPMSVGYPQTSY